MSQTRQVKLEPRITQPTESYVRYYPEIVRLANKQLEEQLWFSSEMEVGLDKMQMLYELDESQRHAVKFLQQIFLRYELIVGNFWTEVVSKTFPRPEVKIAASIVDMTERAIHAEFYNQINTVLGTDTEQDYLAYVNDPELSERVKFLDNLLEQEDKILATLIFGLTETALLFSAFAIFKSFQSNGYNMIPVTVRGTNQSAIDEDLHGQILAEIINTYYTELGVNLIEDTDRYQKLIEAVEYVYKHEQAIIDRAFINGTLNGVSKKEYSDFVCSRLNLYLERLGLPKHFDVQTTTIENWFSKNTYAYKVIDFFTPGVGQEYESNWNKLKLTSAWENDEK